MSNLLISPTTKATNTTTKSTRIITQPLRKKGNCFVCVKPRHHTATCYKRHKKTKENPPKANLVEGEDIIATVVVSK